MNLVNIKITNTLRILKNKIKYFSQKLMKLINLIKNPILSLSILFQLMKINMLIKKSALPIIIQKLKSENNILHLKKYQLLLF